MSSNAAGHHQWFNFINLLLIISITEFIIHLLAAELKLLWYYGQEQQGLSNRQIRQKKRRSTHAYTHRVPVIKDEENYRNEEKKTAH